MSPLVRFLRIPALVAATLCAFPSPTTGQECPAGRISSIRVQTAEVFTLDEFQEGSFMRGVFRTANRIHIDTSESHILSELLFKEGACLDPFLLEESARILRSRVFIKWAEISHQAQPDGTVAVNVRVQDDWTLKVGLGLSFDEGINLEELLLQENNLLGLGLTVAVARVQAREVPENYFKFAAARLFGKLGDVRPDVVVQRDRPFFHQRGDGHPRDLLRDGGDMKSVVGAMRIWYSRLADP